MNKTEAIAGIVGLLIVLGVVVVYKQAQAEKARLAEIEAEAARQRQYAADHPGVLSTVVKFVPLALSIVAAL